MSVAAIFAVLLMPFNTQKAAPNADPLAAIYQRPAPVFDLNVSRNIPNARAATAEQLSAITVFKNAVNAPNMTVRWNDFGGSPDVIYDFASPSYSGTPEQAARAFLSQNARLIRISETNNIRHFNTVEAARRLSCPFQPDVQRDSGAEWWHRRCDER